MIQIQIKNGTPTSGKSLCLTCKRAMILKGQNNEEVIRCSSLDSYVPFKVAECSHYHNTTTPWLHQMEEIAWKIEARKRGTMGFEPENTEMEVIVTPPKKVENP